MDILKKEYDQSVMTPSDIKYISEHRFFNTREKERPLYTRRFTDHATEVICEATEVKQLGPGDYRVTWENVLVLPANRTYTYDITEGVY